MLANHWELFPSIVLFSQIRKSIKIIDAVGMHNNTSYVPRKLQTQEEKKYKSHRVIYLLPQN